MRMTSIPELISISMYTNDTIIICTTRFLPTIFSYMGKYEKSHQAEGVT